MYILVLDHGLTVSLKANKVFALSVPSLKQDRTSSIDLVLMSLTSLPYDDTMRTVQK